MSNSSNIRKIIIVTRDHHDYDYKNDYPLSNLAKKELSVSNLAAFEYAKCNGHNGQSFDDWLDKTMGCWSDNLSNFIANTDYGDNWCIIPAEFFDLSINDCPFRDNDQECCKNCSKPIYDMISNGNDEIYLLYWNRTKGLAKDLGVLLPLICKDCGIVENTKSENLLYIHDDEWGKPGNELLIFDKVKRSKTKEVILDELIKLNFSFAVAFQHVNSPGSIFHQILNMEFGEKPIHERLGKKEDENNCCEKLLDSCDEVLKKTKQ